MPVPCPKPRKSRKRAPRRMLRQPMKARGKRTAKSGGHLFYGPEYVDEARRAWMRQQPCHLTELRTGQFLVLAPPAYGRYVFVVAAHVKSRGSSGPDRDNLIPLDEMLHEEQHRMGWPAFSKKYGFDRFAVAAEYGRRYQAERVGHTERGS